MSRQMRVLVVDDSSMNHEIIEEVLGEKYTILKAEDGLTALLLAERYQPRIVLLDIMLPDMDGYEVCRKLRAMPAMATARIIMVTAKAMPSERAQGFEVGADAYLSKPFDDADLLASMRPMHWAQKTAMPEYIAED